MPTNRSVRDNALGLRNGGMDTPNNYVDTSDMWAVIPPEVREHLADIAARWPTPRAAQPAYGELYDTLRTRDGWDRIIDFTFSGTIIPSTSAAVTASLMPQTDQEQPINLRQGLYPGGLQAYPCVRLVSLVATAATATGALSLFYIEPNGMRLPLGCAPAASTNFSSIPNIISPNPVTDNNPPTLGQLQVQMVSGGSPVACAYQVGIAIVYLRPATQATAVMPENLRRHGGNER